MSDEDRWNISAHRRIGMARHNVSVRNNGRDDAIIYYPGSGSDVSHPLFAAGAKARYLIFVDGGVDHSVTIAGNIKEKHSRLNATEARSILGNLNIRTAPTGAWMFSMARRTRYLFYFHMGHDRFVSDNRGFLCDIFFEKDFWETSADIDLSSVLSLLRVGGHYSTNASLGVLTGVLPLVGLDFVDSYHINGDQYLYRRRTTTRLAWDDLSSAIDEGIRIVRGLMAGEESPLSYEKFPNRTQLHLRPNHADVVAELRDKRQVILQPFTALGINVPIALRNKICRGIVVKALGDSINHCIAAVEEAYG
jgi:hypothetical protein